MRCASRLAGDFSAPGAAEGARERLAPVPWTWLRQVHGRRVVVVEEPGAGCGTAADASVTCCPGAGLVVLTADCAPVALSSEEGVIGIVHAGWRGLLAGVVEAAAAAMERLGASRIFAAVGPCIWPHAYEFSSPELDVLARHFGPVVRATTARGQPALDLPAAVGTALGRAGVALLAESQTCTHCSRWHWSWRARAESGRQATVVWREAAGS